MPFLISCVLVIALSHRSACSNRGPVCLSVSTLTGTTLGDLYSLDLTSRLWADLTPSMAGSIPSPRSFHGFTAHGDRMYVMGGVLVSIGGGEEGGEGRWLDLY